MKRIYAARITDRRHEYIDIVRQSNSGVPFNETFNGKFIVSLTTKLQFNWTDCISPTPSETFHQFSPQWIHTPPFVHFIYTHSLWDRELHLRILIAIVTKNGGAEVKQYQPGSSVPVLVYWYNLKIGKGYSTSDMLKWLNQNEIIYQFLLDLSWSSSEGS